MIPRTPEPEVMDDEVEATVYDEMDHSAVNEQFVTDVVSQAMERNVGDFARSILDLGCGTALIPLEFVRHTPAAQIVACDRSEAMLQIAIKNTRDTPSITPVLADCRSLPFEDESFSIAMSNSLIHHLPGSPEDDYATIRQTLSELLRVLRPGGLLFVRDLCRPDSVDAVNDLVVTYSGGESDVAQRLFRESLHAALTVGEIMDIAITCGLDRTCVEESSDRHWTLTATKR